MAKSEIQTCSKKQALCSKEQLNKIEKTLDTTLIWVDCAKKVVALVKETLKKFD